MVLAYARESEKNPISVAGTFLLRGSETGTMMKPSSENQHPTSLPHLSGGRICARLSDILVLLIALWLLFLTACAGFYLRGLYQPYQAASLFKNFATDGLGDHLVGAFGVALGVWILIRGIQLVAYLPRYVEDFLPIAGGLVGVVAYEAAQSGMRSADPAMVFQNLQWNQVAAGLIGTLLFVGFQRFCIPRSSPGNEITLRTADFWSLWCLFVALAHIVTPTVFLVVVYFIIAKQFTITWEVLVTLALACSPFLLALFSFYIRRLKIGDNEIEPAQMGELLGADAKKLDEQKPVPTSLEPAEPASKPPKVPGEETEPEHPGPAISEALSYGKLSREAKKVLRTLWRYQLVHIPTGSNGRWGFKIVLEAADFPEFAAGVSELIQRGLVIVDSRQLVFLSDLGIEFCHQNRNGLAGGGDVWSTFSPA